jgi:hypothetical protein
MTIHDQIVTQKSYLIIFIDENDINDEINVSIITLFFSNDNSSSMMIERKQVYLSSFMNYTMYSKELIELNLTLKIMKTYLDDHFVIIFVDNQIAIRALFFLKQQSDQYMLKNLVKKFTNSEKRFHLH